MAGHSSSHLASLDGLRCFVDSNRVQLVVSAAGKPMPMSKDGNAEMHVLPVPLTLLSAISTLRVSLPSDLRTPEPRRSTLLTLKVIGCALSSPRS